MKIKTMTNAARTLEARGLCKQYGKQTVLDHVDLAVEPGCIYGLIGRNGAGKTTLLSILTGQNTKNSGEVTYGGEPVWENPHALSDLCFARELNPGSEVAALQMEEYLLAARLFCPRWDEEYARTLIKKFGLDTKKRINKLSKGQMSMVTITAALASRAPVTILDEPAAGLDVVMRECFYRLLLDDYAETNRTFVISTHIIEEAAGVFERVIVLDEGRVIANSQTDDLVDQFRYVSGSAQAVDRALAACGLQPLQQQGMGPHKTAAVRGTPEQFARLAAEPDLELSGLNLQNVFVALCGHGDEEG